MADQVVALEASDILSLGSNWIPQGTPKNTGAEHARMKKANGDFQKFSDTFNQMESFTVPYKWNADTGLGAALDALCGEVSGGYLITGISIETVHNDYPTVNFTAHQHEINPHETGLPTYTIGSDIVAVLTGAYGCYDFLGKATGAVCAQSSSYSINTNHVDAECAGGDHWTGTNTEGLEACQVQYIGNAATPTVLSDGWVFVSSDENDSNDEFDSSTINAERPVARN